MSMSPLLPAIRHWQKLKNDNLGLNSETLFLYSFRERKKKRRSGGRLQQAASISGKTAQWQRSAVAAARCRSERGGRGKHWGKGENGALIKRAESERERNGKRRQEGLLTPDLGGCLRYVPLFIPLFTPLIITPSSPLLYILAICAYWSSPLALV